MDGRLLGDDAAFLLRALALVTLDHIDAANDDAAVLAAHLDHLAAAAFIAARDHHYRVAALYVSCHDEILNREE